MFWGLGVKGRLTLSKPPLFQTRSEICSGHPYGPEERPLRPGGEAPTARRRGRLEPYSGRSEPYSGRSEPYYGRSEPYYVRSEPYSGRRRAPLRP